MSNENPIEPNFVHKIPPGDERERRVCTHCNFIDYSNPKVVVGSVVTAPDGRFLLCKRAIEPQKGFWTLPAGFLENGESPEDGAKREAREEACVEINLTHMVGIYSVPRISQVQLFFAGQLGPKPPAPGPESQDVALVAWPDIPWEDMAFPTAVWALKDFYAQSQSDQVKIRTQGPDFEALDPFQA